jgi:hypothetical protein
MNKSSYENIREEELKNKIAQDYFEGFDCSKIIGNLDFCVSVPNPHWQRDAFLEFESFFWAEAKSGKIELAKAVVQLILTLGKARTFDKHLPPMYLGAFNTQKITFIEYTNVHNLFYQTDFNWNVTPSQHDTKEFKQIYHIIKQKFEQQALEFHFEQDKVELKQFIQAKLITRKAVRSKIQIDKNNFVNIYNKWLTAVKPSIAVDWALVKAAEIIDGDFYLADVLSQENTTFRDKLFVVLKNNKYELDRNIERTGLIAWKTAEFKDNQKAHSQFWNKYERPPKQEYWDYIIQRRDLLVPPDVRERKGSFFTPQIWVELSQKYLTDVLGDDWQDEYYIWDCAAGTGNLLAGLVNKYRIYASTLDRQDVDVIKDRIKNGANLVENHVFQFDFLNDDFDKLPQSLQNIINNPEKRKKLVIYINPPYAEAASIDNVKGTGVNKTDVAVTTKTYSQYQASIGIAGRELFAQFFARIYDNFPNAILAQFSKLKIVQAPNFFKFRNFFKAEFKKGFVCPANTFDNVKGEFPIGFNIWFLNGKNKVENIYCDIFDKNCQKIGLKSFYAYDESIFITDWYRQYHTRIESKNNIGAIGLYGSDFQHSNYIRITNCDEHPNRWSFITANNLIQTSIYYAVRHCIAADWLNDRDQFLYPKDGWKTDLEFQNDCLALAIFHSQNRISSKSGTNHWIPFTETEINAPEAFESSFMSDFLKGKIKKEASTNLFDTPTTSKKQPLIFSAEAQTVFAAGKKLWQYYHLQSDTNTNASLYDIREHFQGRNDAGKMNNKSEDEDYMKCIKRLREALHVLETKLQPKVYEYGFLKA